MREIVSRDFRGLRVILMEKAWVPGIPLEVYLLFNLLFHIQLEVQRFQRVKLLSMLSCGRRSPPGSFTCRGPVSWRPVKAGEYSNIDRRFKSWKDYSTCCRRKMNCGLTLYENIDSTTKLTSSGIPGTYSMLYLLKSFADLENLVRLSLWIVPTYCTVEHTIYCIFSSAKYIICKETVHF